MAGRPSDNPALVLAWTVDRPRAIAFVTKHLRDAGGNLAAAARAIGVNRRTLHRWILSDKNLARAVAQARQ